MENVIEVENLAHRYGKRSIYEDLSFSVPAGKIFGLLGKNGVGKTTLIKILMGFMRPASGRCRVFGENSHNLSPATRARIGLLFEGHLAYDFMTIAQIERFYAAFYPQWDRRVYYDLVDRLGLEKDHMIRNMSCGQRSQVVLGLIFAQMPDLMILDDYSMGLDAGYRRLFLDYLREYTSDGAKTVFITSHVVLDLEQLVDEVIFLERGGAIHQTSLSDFRTRFKQYQFRKNGCPNIPEKDHVIRNVEIFGDTVSLYSFQSRETVEAHMQSMGMAAELTRVEMNLEDAFVGFTGRY
ncbi:MAG: ABC transporter ATP-binding protein [Deltaproteobacteria bacterium]|nr:ABC transporter ATP-binding protein [Deltaproteobacteria bacterium]